MSVNNVLIEQSNRTLQFQAFCQIKQILFSWAGCCCCQENDVNGGEVGQTLFWTISYNKTGRSSTDSDRRALLYKMTSIRVWLHVEKGGASCPAGERGRTRFVSAPCPSDASPHLDFLFVIHSHSCTFQHACTAKSRITSMWQVW